MNYDKANDLAKAMRDSEEYKALMEAQQRVEGDATATGLVRTFMAQQMEWEYAKLAKAPNEAELLKKQEDLMPMIQANEAAQAYLQAHVRWSQISNDIYRIISAPITEGMKILDHGDEQPKY
ncbi:YlbF family regulator [Veillonella montpellierensis]|uniref:YlbF family regulator n=1 Tax=Veillonella montpellierensis TaxID=187328 RepID=UPI0023F6C8E6|nr:YlbF family regulator [Veillonella montpellierensis]